MPAGELKKELLSQLSSIPALVQQLQFIVKNPTVGKPATFAKVDSVIRETRSLMEAVNRVVTATLSCRQHVSFLTAPDSSLQLYSCRRQTVHLLAHLPHA